MGVCGECGVQVTGGPMNRCEACNGGPEHHGPEGCRFWFVYRDRDGVPFKTLPLTGYDVAYCRHCGLADKNGPGHAAGCPAA